MAQVERVIRVLIAEPQEYFRRLAANELSAEPDIEAVAIVATGEEALKALDEHEIDVVLTAIALGGRYDGLALLKKVGERAGAPKFIIFTGIEDPMLILDAFMHGAEGLLHKTSSGIDLPSWVRQASEPGLLVCPQSALMLRAALEHKVPQGRSPLTRREQEVLRLVSIGASRVRVADRLDISKHTVNTHMRTIFEKLAVHNQLEAVAEAQRRGLL